MAETRLRRKRRSEDEDEDEHQSPNKRNRPGSAAFGWLWAPSTTPDPSTPGLWTYPDAERLFRSQADRVDGVVPRSFSLPPPEPTLRRTRRRGAISVTSSSPSELDRHLAVQLQQQIASISLKTAPKDDEDEEGDDDFERMRRGLEDVQIDAALPSILGISLDFDRRLDLGSSDSPEVSQREGKVIGETPPPPRSPQTPSSRVKGIIPLSRSLPARRRFAVSHHPGRPSNREPRNRRALTRKNPAHRTRWVARTRRPPAVGFRRSQFG